MERRSICTKFHSTIYKKVMKKLKMVIIGATGSGFKRTIPGVKGSVLIEVVAIQGRNKEKLNKICNDYNIKHYYMDTIEMLSKEEYDIIYIANPPFMHYESINEAVKTEKAIICEKPLDSSYENAIKIWHLLKDYSAPFMVAHHMRHQKAYDDIKRIIQEGKIGQVEYACFQWGFQLNTDASNAKWKLDSSLGGGGTFSDNGVHIIDLVIGLFGKPEGVFGHCFKKSFEHVYDNETAMLCYKNNTIILNSSQFMQNPGNHILIYGTEGRIESFGAIGEKSISKLIITQKGNEEIITYPMEHLYGAEVENFVRYYFLNDINANPGTGLEDALLSLKIIDLIRKAHNNRQYYSLEE